MNKNTKIIIIILLAAAVLIFGAVFAVIKFKKPVYPFRNGVSNGAGLNLPELSQALPAANPAENIAANITAPEAAKPDSGKLDINQADVDEPAFKTYNHTGYGFSFDYPADLSVEAFLQEGEEAVLVQSENQETGIVVFIYPFDEPGPISQERILKDVPDMKIENGRQIKIAGSIDALSFDNNEREMGATKEIWFIRNGFLYQISAVLGSEAALEKIAATWKFD